jgi:murein DD-endopeptidase MepM/ murein hydrolase activator NlpD
MKRLLCAIALSLACLGAWAQTLPRSHLVPGGVAVIPVDAPDGYPPRVYFGFDRVMVVRDQKRWFAVVGLPQQLEPGVHAIAIAEANFRVRTLSFTVGAKEYGQQHITLRDNNLVEPSPKDLERILEEQNVIRAMLGHWSDNARPALPFELPAKGRVSGVFGTRRFFNNQERQPHAGLDLAAPRGSPALAPAEGVVIGTGTYFFNGNTVFIDHGQGLVSMFNHLDRIDVEPGAKLKRGQRVGTIGATGRATGPHLHWTVSLNSARIDPVALLSERALKQLSK